MTHSRTIRRLNVGPLWALAGLLPGVVFADTTAEQSAKAGKFFGQHCTQCHGAVTSKGRVTLRDFSFEQSTAARLKL